jgi:hypothetical protein
MTRLCAAPRIFVSGGKVEGQCRGGGQRGPEERRQPFESVHLGAPSESGKSMYIPLDKCVQKKKITHTQSSDAVACLHDGILVWNCCCVCVWGGGDVMYACMHYV